MNHQAVILDHLQQGKTISQAEAIELCDCYRLSYELIGEFKA